MPLDTRYVFADFWQWQNGSLSEEGFEARFAAANKAAHVALGRQDTVTMLAINCATARTSWRKPCSS